MGRIEQNINTMKKFEKMINTADENLAKELISDRAAFSTPASKEILYGGKGYLSVVHWLRAGFPDVRWKLEDICAEETKTAVYWTCSGTHMLDFLGIPATGKKFSAKVMNFYYFDDNGKIINDIAAEGMIAILRAIGACP